MKERPGLASEAVEGLEEGWTMIDEDYEYYDLEARAAEAEGPAFGSSVRQRGSAVMEKGSEPSADEDEGA